MEELQQNNEYELQQLKTELAEKHERALQELKNELEVAQNSQLNAARRSAAESKPNFTMSMDSLDVEVKVIRNCPPFAFFFQWLLLIEFEGQKKFFFYVGKITDGI